MSALPPPFPVSPVIKLSRWTLLIAGVFYGYSKKSALAYREIGIREEAHKRKVIRDAQIQAEKAIASDRDVAMLASLGDPDPNKPIKVKPTAATAGAKDPPKKC